MWKRNEKKAKIDIKSDNWLKSRQAKDKKQKAKKNKRHKAQYLRIADLKWYEEKKKKWEKKWDYIDEKTNDWDVERKVNDWDAKPYEAARDDRKNVVSMKSNCGEKTRDWLRTAGLYDGERGHMISITSMMKGLMMNLIIWLMILSIW